MTLSIKPTASESSEKSADSAIPFRAPLMACCCWGTVMNLPPSLSSFLILSSSLHEMNVNAPRVSAKTLRNSLFIIISFGCNLRAKVSIFTLRYARNVKKCLKHAFYALYSGAQGIYFGLGIIKGERCTDSAGNTHTVLQRLGTVIMPRRSSRVPMSDGWMFPTRNETTALRCSEFPIMRMPGICVSLLMA